MRGSASLVAILLAPLTLGCAATVDIVVDERGDLAQYRTWDWSTRARPDVDAPDGDAAALGAQLAQLIEQGLLASGFERDRDHAEFFVTYRLAIRRRTVVVNQPRAAYQLDSHHASGSFLIEGFERTTRLYSVIQLAVGVAEARGRPLWRARLVQQAEDELAGSLEDAVAILFERFPRQRPGDGADGDPRRRPACGEADSARQPNDGGGRFPQADLDPEPDPDPRCPGEDVGPDRPGPESPPPPLEPETLA